MKLIAKNTLYTTCFFSLSAQCSDVTIKSATEKDLAGIYSLSHKNYETHFKPLWQKYYTPQTPQHQTINEFVKEKENNENNAIEDFTNRQANKEEYGLLVAVKETSIVGYCRFKKTDLTTLYINNIFVEKSHRCNGVAKKLVNAVFNTWSTIKTCNFRALIHYGFINDIYQKYGYEQRDEVSLDPSTGKINSDPSAPKTHYEYTYTIKK